ncbi:hypothetical protein FALBO_6523 [Fusarium albosuccineum]|uniref:Uncharacterized protein n=1 Tax=Fusarium albosuccineum TaxID=1237068 RepID=A0A8H4LD38_9HYPO|nr:hypothetical protein FALBO_6523 [Fusarium albosuccineum]
MVPSYRNWRDKDDMCNQAWMMLNRTSDMTIYELDEPSVWKTPDRWLAHKEMNTWDHPRRQPLAKYTTLELYLKDSSDDVPLVGSERYSTPSAPSPLGDQEAGIEISSLCLVLLLFAILPSGFPSLFCRAASLFCGSVAFKCRWPRLGRDLSGTYTTHLWASILLGSRAEIQINKLEPCVLPYFGSTKWNAFTACSLATNGVGIRDGRIHSDATIVTGAGLFGLVPHHEALRKSRGTTYFVPTPVDTILAKANWANLWSLSKPLAVPDRLGGMKSLFAPSAFTPPHTLARRGMGAHPHKETPRCITKNRTIAAGS